MAPDTPWYVIRTMPGAQMPQREYVVEETHSSKGYRITMSLDPRMSAVERVLAQAGYSYYMPAEYRVVRNRKKTRAYVRRRFPLLPGYLFVSNVSDWFTLRQQPGVSGIVGTGEGRPLPIGVMDILMLRQIEARSEAAADAELERLRNDELKAERKAQGNALRQAKRKLNSGKRVKILWGDQVGREAVLQGWTDDQHLKALVEKLDAVENVVIPFGAVRLVA